MQRERKERDAMVDIYGSHFEYAGVSSRRYGLIIANAETKRNTSLSGSIKGVTVFNKATKSNSLVDNDYSNSPISIDIEIVTDNEQPMERRDMREVEKWLFNRATYKKLYIDEEDDIYGETHEIINGEQKRLYLNCRFVNPSRLEYNNGVVGYKATLEADSGYWWQDAVTKTFAVSDSNVTRVTWSQANVGRNIMVFSVQTDTDIDEYIYPVMSFTTGNSTSDITIVNLSDTHDSIKDGVLGKVDTMRTSSGTTKNLAYTAFVAYILPLRWTGFSDVPANTTISIDSAINGISKPDEVQYDVFGHFTNRYFPRLLDGDNLIVVVGDITSVSFEFNNRRML